MQSESAIAPDSCTPIGPVAATSQTITPADDSDLESLIVEFLGPHKDSYGVIVKQLPKGAQVAINADQIFEAASLFKLWVMYELYLQRERLLLDFQEEMTITEEYAEYDLGTLKHPVDTVITVEDALEDMITYSDNTAAHMLYGRVGAENINLSIKDLGMNSSVLQWGYIITSAEDNAALLDSIACGRAVSPEASRAMIDLMLKQTVLDRLPALLPADTLVAHKTGNLDNATHDAGIVYSPGATYIMVVLSNHYYDPQPIARLSRLVYDYFNPSTPP